MPQGGKRNVSDLTKLQTGGKKELGVIQYQARQVTPARVNPVYLLAAQRLKAKRDSMPPRSDPVAWMEQNYYIPETRAPIQFEAYQARALREALALDKNGLFKYSTIIWSEPKKSGKTSVAAAIVDWVMSEMPYASAKIVANDLEQADSRAAKMLRTNFKLHPREGVEVLQSRNLIRYPNGSEVQSIAIDPSGEAGANDNIISFDELWGAHEKAKETMWTEMTVSPLKFGKGFRLVTSYAGHLGESNLLFSLYQQGVDEHAQFPGVGVRFDWCDEFDPPLECYHNDAARLFCLWNTVPRLPWQTPDYYASEATILATGEFNRIHRNQWSAAVEQFVPIEWWDACYDAQMPPPAEDELFIVALDAAVSHDCFGIVGVSRRGDDVYLRFSRAWSPPKGGTISFTNLADADDIEYPEGQLRQLYRDHKTLEFPYDPTHLSEMPKRLMRDGYGFYRPFNQGKDRLIADKAFHDLIAGRKIHHDGDPFMRAHIQNANKETHDSKTLRIVKRAANLHIDLCVAASMACARVLHYNLGGE